MERHLVDNDIDLAVSRVAVASDPVSFALIGRRGAEAWVGGMGTAPESRRRGVAARTLKAALAEAARDGAETVSLEVLEENDAAISLYRRLGFTVTRRLVVCSLRDLDPPRSDWRPMDVDGARSWIAAQRLSREPWQRDDPALVRIGARAQPLHAIGIPRGAEIAAALIYTDGTAGASILQMAARDDAVAADALRAAGTVAGWPIRLLNFPADEPVAVGAASLGSRPDHVQFEMQVRIVDAPLGSAGRGVSS